MTVNEYDNPSLTGGAAPVRVPTAPEPVLPEYAEPIGPAETVAGVPARAEQPGSRVIAMGRVCGRTAGTAARYVGSLRRRWSGGAQVSLRGFRQEVANFVRRHPSALIGAGIAGFACGLAIRSAFKK